MAQKKSCSITEVTLIAVKPTGENRGAVRYCEQKLMREVGTTDPRDVPNAKIINTLLIAGYNSIRGRK